MKFNNLGVVETLKKITTWDTETDGNNIKEVL